jgi:thiamine-phosphate pyrophosphorylase
MPPGTPFHLPKIYPILDSETLQARGCPPETAAKALLEAGAQILQFRHKPYWSRDTLVQAERIRDLCRDHHATFILNDRADYAKLLGAGLHLGQNDLPPRVARDLLGPDAVIGFSTHNAEQLEAAAAETVNYLAIGPIFSTASKRNPDPEVGLDNLTRWRALSPVPLVAIGGITRASARDVWTAGADSIAVIGDIYPTICDPVTINQRMVEWLQLQKK